MEKIFGELPDEKLSKLIQKENKINPLEDFQPSNPFTLNLIDPLLDTEKSAYFMKKANLEKPFNLDLNELIPVFKDILSGDKNALMDPQFNCLNLANIKLAIDWLQANNSLNPNMKDLLGTESWRLVYRAKPPTAEEFLSYAYLGPQSETMYEPVREHFIEAFSPIKPYRTVVLTPHIGWGKSLFTVLANLYISTCTSLMWHPYKFFGQSQPLDCKVYTKEGYKLMGDIKVGDKVLTPENTEAEVIQIHPQGKIATYEIELDDGRKTRCSAQHLWKVSYRIDSNGEKIWETVNTQFMIDNPDLDFELPDFYY